MNLRKLSLAFCFALSLSATGCVVPVPAGHEHHDRGYEDRHAAHDAEERREHERHEEELHELNH